MSKKIINLYQVQDGRIMGSVELVEAGLFHKEWKVKKEINEINSDDPPIYLLSLSYDQYDIAIKSFFDECDDVEVRVLKSTKQK